MKKHFFILFSLILSFVLFTPKANALGLETLNTIGSVFIENSVPVNDKQIREDIRLFRQKEIGTGASTLDAIKKTAGGITGIISFIGRQLPTLNLPTIPIPKIGGLDIGKWASGIGDFLGGLKSSPAWDTLTVTLVRLATDKIFDDMTDWVNRGFDGNPAFAVNLNDWLKQSGDAVVGQALNEITNGFACQPFRLEIRAAISRDFGTTNRGRYFQNSCSLSDITGNIDDFLGGDFNQGGWQSWFRITQVDENNPYGEYMMAVSNITANIAGARDIEVSRLNWAQGFIGTRKCVAHPYKTGPTQTINGVLSPGQLVEDKDKCLVWQETTPGHLLADQVSKVTGTAVDQVNLANRFDEFLGAVVNQLTNRVFSSRGFITNTGGRTYKPEPITGTIDYGGGSGTSASVGECSVDRTQAVVGDKVTWSVNFSGSEANNPEFIWNGTELSEGQTTSEPTLEMTYNSAGTKSMSIIASYDEPDIANPLCSTTAEPIPGGQGQIFNPANTNTNCTYPTKHTEKVLSCAQTTKILQYKPVVASCVPSVQRAATDKDVVVYTITVDGGSGTLYDAYMNGDQYEVTWFDSRGNLHTGFTPMRSDGTFVDYRNNSPVIFSKSGSLTTLKFGIKYSRKQSVGATATVLDADKNLDQLSGIDCTPNGKVVVDD